MRNNILAPSILAADFRHLEQDIQEAVGAGAEYLHIDVMDGSFVPSISFGMPVIQAIRPTTDCVFDVHMMVDQPERYIGEIARCGADLITVHAEATHHLHRVVGQIHEHGLKAGVALNPATPLQALEYVLEDVDMVLLMTVDPGFGGQKLIPAVLDKIRALRQQAKVRGLEFDIEVDGGINADTLPLAMEAGANVFVAGSAVFGGEIADRVSELQAILKRH